MAEFIGKGLSTITFPMDKQQSLFLTVKIMVIPIDEGLSIHGMAMKARGNEDPDFSDDEPELGGGELMDILTHVHSAYKDKGVTEESKRPHEGKKLTNIVKAGAANVITGAIGINTITNATDRNSLQIGGTGDSQKDKQIDSLKQRVEAEKSKSEKLKSQVEYQQDQNKKFEKVNRDLHKENTMLKN